MTLQDQNISLSFAQGVDTKTDPKQVVAGKLLDLKNAVFGTLREIRKRNGYQAISGTVTNYITGLNLTKVPGSIAAGNLLASYKDELVETDGFNLFSKSDSDLGFVYKGRLENASTSAIPVMKNNSSQLNADSAINPAGYKVFAAEDALGGLYASVVDTVTGQVQINYQAVSLFGVLAQVVTVGANTYVLFFNTIDGKIYSSLVNAAGVNAPVALITDAHATTRMYDAEVNGSTLYVAYYSSAPGVKIVSYNSALTPIANASKAETATNGLGVFFDSSNNVWVGYGTSTSVKAFVMDSALAVTVISPQTLDSGATAQDTQNVTGVFTNNKGYFFYDQLKLPETGNAATTTTANFVQPLPGLATTVNVTVASVAHLIVGETVYIDTGGYYQIYSIIGTTVTLINLGSSGNAAPGATINSGSVLRTVADYSNASVNFNTLATGPVIGTPAIFINSCLMASKAFLYGSIPHVYLVHPSVLQQSGYLASLYNYINVSSSVPNAYIVASVYPSTLGAQPNASALTHVNLVSAGVYQAALTNVTLSVPFTDPSGTEAQINTAGVNSYIVDFTTTNPKISSLGNYLQVGASKVSMYDGACVVEQGFLLFPETIVVTNVPGFGDLSAGSYGYQVIYKWVDNQGQVHRSAPSLVVSVAAPAGSGNTIRVPMLRVTEKKNVTIVIYRTQVNGTSYQRLQSPFAEIPNDPSQNYFTYTDSASDLSISGNEVLYTAGEVENIAPPAASFTTEYKNRSILFPTESKNSFLYSKQVLPGSPVEYSDLFVQNIGTAGGDLIAGIEMDDKLILFKQKSILYMVGSGPSPTGTNNDFSDALSISTDAGCKDPGSVVLTPFGIMFKSLKGIYMIDRSLQVSYIGSEVEAYNQYTVNSAQLIANVNQVRFILSNGMALVFDYLVGQWSVFTNHSGISSCIYQNNFTYLSAAGSIFEETPGVYTDAGSAISLSLVTSWLQLANIQGYQRVKKMLILGDFKSAHTLNISVAVDFDSSVIQSDAITASTPYQYRINFQRQKCQALQLTISETDTSPAEALALSTFSFEAGIKKGLNKLGATQSFG